MLGRLCRLCAKLNTEGTEKFIYDIEEEQLADLDVEMDLAELINTFLPVKVTRTDPLPKQICELCVEKLKATHEFLVNCIAAEDELRALCEQHVFCVPAMKKDEIELPNGDESIVSTSDLLKVLTSTETDNETENLDHENICCPLCYEGKMAIGEDDFGVLRDEEREDVKKELVEAKSLEELLYARHRRANEGLDASDSDASMEPISDFSEIKLTSAREIASDDHNISAKTGNIPNTHRKNLPVSRKPMGYISDDEEDHVVMFDDEDDEDYEEGADINAKRKKSGRGRWRGRGRGSYRGRSRYQTTKTPSTDTVQETSKETSVPQQYDETIMWIQGDGDQTLPLVQCLICNRWLPGFETCLQHSLVHHSDEDDDSLTCPRCLITDLLSHEDLIEHFQVHMTINEDPVKQAEITSCFSTLRYSCTLCRKSFSWMLNLLLHPCPGVETDNSRCETCEVNFNSRLRYAFHMQFHAEEIMVLDCDVCGQGFSTDNELFDHVTLAHLEDNLSCGECGMKFQGEPDLALHALEHTLHQSAPSTCLDCGQVCQDMQTFREHCATHMAVRPYHCDHCGRSFSRHTRLKQHVISHLYDESMECWECTTCNQVYSDQSKALIHNQSGHTVRTTILEKVYRCEFCDTCCIDPEGMNIHRGTHKSLERRYQCVECNVEFPSFSQCASHKSSYHGEELLVPQPGDFTVPKHFLCGECSFSTPHWSFVLTHRKMRHSEVTAIVSCKSCPKMFRNHWELLQHQRADHDPDPRGSRKKSLECELCGVRYMYQHTLDFHMERKHRPPGEEVTGDERFQCEECGKVFKYQTSLRMHQNMHLGRKNFFCDLCNKSFITKITLNVHLKRSHEGIKSHKCEYCGKAFFHRVTRDDHMRIHTGEKPFQCTYCNVRFRLKSMLTDHVKIHNDDRPYACDICGTRFRRMVHMKQHRMLHTGEKPFQCLMCQKAFHLKQELKRHYKMKHHNRKDEQDDYIYAE